MSTCLNAPNNGKANYKIVETPTPAQNQNMNKR